MLHLQSPSPAGLGVRRGGYGGGGGSVDHGVGKGDGVAAAVELGTIINHDCLLKDTTV